VGAGVLASKVTGRSVLSWWTKRVHAACTGQRPALAQRELGDVGGVEGETLFPHLALAVLGKANLLQPEAGNRRVQQPEQPEVLASRWRRQAA
jgi:hypothetical protein